MQPCKHKTLGWTHLIGFSLHHDKAHDLACVFAGAKQLSGVQEHVTQLKHAGVVATDHGLILSQKHGPAVERNIW